MSNQDLFIIIKALLWYLPTTQVPSDEEIMKFIEIHKEKLKKGEEYETKKTD